MATQKKCINCGEKRPVGGDPSELGKATELCVKCFRASIHAGKCPGCGFKFTTKAHQTKCPLGAEAAA